MQGADTAHAREITSCTASRPHRPIIRPSSLATLGAAAEPVHACSWADGLLLARVCRGSLMSHRPRSIGVCEPSAMRHRHPLRQKTAGRTMNQAAHPPTRLEQGERRNRRERHPRPRRPPGTEAGTRTCQSSPSLGSRLTRAMRAVGLDALSASVQGANRAWWVQNGFEGLAHGAHGCRSRIAREGTWPIASLAALQTAGRSGLATVWRSAA